jgi:hypothetical protein
MVAEPYEVDRWFAVWVPLCGCLTATIPRNNFVVIVKTLEVIAIPFYYLSVGIIGGQKG